METGPGSPFEIIEEQVAGAARLNEHGAVARAKIRS
jgi:hypothetical protein